MAENSTDATVRLQVNGEQARETLQNLKEHALDLTNQIAKAAAQGDRLTLKKLRKELAETKKQIREMESATQQVDDVMRHLDKATPKELQKTLSTLNKQLEYMERGSNAWTEQTAKIRLVKEEMAKVNAEMAKSQTWLERLNAKVSDWQNVVLGATAAFSGAVMAGRSAVQAYADIEEEIANTVKYTGMADEDVRKLNEAFKEMSTRTPRAQLNELAQEAGRLGKNTYEDVLGYVEAADQINVALVDLGEGATQTIAKLTDIFNVKETNNMDTKQSMLAVGSAVNVLSQNCTADKKYLVEFAQRMAGIGATAKMSIPEILAFAATLDANGQKCEMSASSLGKLIMMLYKEPAKMAKQVGLDVKTFTDTMNRSTTEGVEMFLGQIKKMGSKDGLAVLAPLFDQLGMDGVRMSQVLATLADKLEMVKWEQGEANKAFNEATSATHEYEIFNNTVQAGLDKAKKGFAEMTIELGEKLQPVMRHVITSGSATLRLLSSLITFVSKHYVALGSLTAAWVAYEVAVNAATIASKVHHTWTVLITKAQAALQTTTILLKAAYYALTGQMEKAKAAMVALNMLSKTNPWGILAATITAAVAALALYLKKNSELSLSEKTMNDIRTQAAQKVVEQKNKIDILVKAAQNETLSLKERQNAVDQLNAIIPDYNAHLDATSHKYSANKEKLDEYIASLTRLYELQGAKDKLVEIGKQKAELAIQLKEAQRGLDQARANSASTTSNNAGTIQTSGGAVAPSSYHAAIGNAGEIQAYTNKVANLNGELDELLQAEKDITDVYGKDLQKQAVTPQAPSEDPNGGGDTPTFTPKGKTTKTKKEDKWKEEKEWREREEAAARIAYAKGETDYEQYTQRMDAIAVEFHQRKLNSGKATAQEEVVIQAEYYEALKKQSQDAQKQSAKEEEDNYADAIAREKQRYIDGQVNYETYENACEQLELKHLRNMVQVYEEGSEERIKAERAYQDKLLEVQKKNQKKYEDALKKHQDELKKLKDTYFGLNANERQTAYNKDLENLNEVFQAEIKAAGDNAAEKLRIEEAFQKAKLALQKKYNIAGINDAKNAAEKSMREITEWLNSDVGKAVVESFDTIVSQMSSIFSGLSDIINAELEIQEAAIEDKYDAEISAAEGNKSKTVALENQKEKDIAKAKNEANRKLFAMQVIQAVASTALSAINAYSSAAQVPYVGYILAPIAAAMAVAAGAIQIASIKKQQQASEAQGYSEGGFTRQGKVDEPAGIVHAGEWVASQKLLSNPQAKAIINTLDYAQRTNTIGSLSASDVSQSITAPTQIARAQSSGELAAVAITSNELSRSIANLNTRLQEPFVTVNTVTGDKGIQRAQDEYNQLIRNKTPKSRRS